MLCAILHCNLSHTDIIVIKERAAHGGGRYSLQWPIRGGGGGGSAQKGYMYLLQASGI